MKQTPKCKLCGSDLRGYERPEQTVHHAEIGDLKGRCPIHDWQEITLEEQQMLVDIALERLRDR